MTDAADGAWNSMRVPNNSHLMHLVSINAFELVITLVFRVTVQLVSERFNARSR